MEPPNVAPPPRRVCPGQCELACVTFRPVRAAVIFVLVSLNLSALAAAPSGDEIYKKRCSGCHEQLSPRIPHREALQKMPSARILRALDSGAMMAVAFV